MTLTLNGEDRELDVGADQLPLAQVLEALELGSIPVLVEHNGVALRPREHEACTVANGDTLEIIRIVAGG